MTSHFYSFVITLSSPAATMLLSRSSVIVAALRSGPDPTAALHDLGVRNSPGCLEKYATTISAPSEEYSSTVGISESYT